MSYSARKYFRKVHLCTPRKINILLEIPPPGGLTKYCFVRFTEFSNQVQGVYTW